MINRTVEISSAPTTLRVHDEQLLIERNGAVAGRIPLEDIGLLVIDEQQTIVSARTLQGLMEHQGVALICNKKHLPSGMLVPIVSHSTLQQKIALQLELARPMRKRLWRHIVRGKILAQARVLGKNSSTAARLREAARTMRSGDPENVEAQMARFYWQAWLGSETEFKRDQDGDGINALLNYGYAIVRASLARACVIAGLQPAIGIHHSNRSNPFCLVDDLIEPLRPIVDEAVRDLHRAGNSEIKPDTKKTLLALLYKEVRYADQKSPLVVAIQHYVFGFVRCLENKDEKMRFIQW